MSRTIADLTPGAKIYLDETVNGAVKHTPHIYLGLDGGGNARILRQYAPLAKRMHSVNVASYAGCEIDDWLIDTETGYLSRFDAATLNALVNTEIKYVDYNQSGDGSRQLLQIARKCFLLSYSEEGYGDDPAGNEGPSFLPALRAFYLAEHPGESTVSDNNARITYNEEGTAVGAWMRSAYSASQFRYVSAGGGAHNNNALNGCWPRPALSVAPATIVSDEGADAIFLLPDGRRTVWSVEAEMSVGESTERPQYCKVAMDRSGISSCTIDVCNNYGDSNKIWTRCSSTGYAALTNLSKTTENWEVGVRITAVGGTPDCYVGEPIVTVGVEQEE